MLLIPLASDNGVPFPPGLYEVAVQVDNTSSAGQKRSSNTVLLRIDPNPNMHFKLAAIQSRCVRITPGWGDDEIGWRAWIGKFSTATPANGPIGFDLQSVAFPEWDGVEDGKSVNWNIAPLFDDSFGNGGAIVVGLTCHEIDDEDAYNEQVNQFDDAFALIFGKIIKFATNAAEGLSDDDVAKELLEAGVAEVKDNVLFLIVAGIAVLVGVTVGSLFWALWAPPELVALDVFALDAALASQRTDGRRLLPAPTRRPAIAGAPTPVTETPVDTGNDGDDIRTWVQDNQYRTSDGRPDYILRLQITRSQP